MEKEVNLLVTGGKVTPAPPVGPSLAPLGLNIGKVVAEINAKTKEFEGLKVPVKVIVNTKTKEYRIEVGTPPTIELIKKEAKIQKGSGKPNEEFVADVSFDVIVKVAKQKFESLNCKTLKAAVTQVIGSCISAGIKIDGKDPREVLKEVINGAYDDKIR